MKKLLAKDAIMAWHFLPSAKAFNHDWEDKRPEVGKTYRITGKPELCERGLHACRNVFHALSYAPGTVLCRVKCFGWVSEEGDKFACTSRRIVEMHGVGDVVKHFAVWCARNTPIGEGKVLWDLLTDQRSKDAIIAAERFLLGQIKKDELEAAAEAAAWAAAEAAAWAAAEAAAWAAAEAAAWAAAGAAAGAAAWAAARAAARAAAEAAAGAAATEAQDKEFNRLIAARFNS